MDNINPKWAWGSGASKGRVGTDLARIAVPVVIAQRLDEVGQV